VLASLRTAIATNRSILSSHPPQGLEYARLDDPAADSASGDAVLEATNTALRLQLSQAVEQLGHATRAQSDLLANVSHELRTPLTAILGFAEVLVTGLDGPLNPRQLDDATTIQTNGRRLLQLIDDLIDIAEIGAQRLHLRTQVLDSTAALTRVVTEIRPLAGQKGIALTFDAPVRSIQIEADPQRFHEMALNLLSNAVKYTPSGGSVRVHSSDDHPEESDGLPMATIEVVDSGIGIAEADQERIFEKFERVAGPDDSGTGLGLSITRELATLHGGSLSVDSTPGLGSRFILRLPLAGVSRPPSPDGLAR
jgi:two-component system, cell cycle sensor histidine kinase DivJ